MRLLTLLFAVVGMLASMQCEAGVVFLPRAEGSTGARGSADDVSDKELCENSGYTFTSCLPGKAIEKCPYATGYYSSCCIDGFAYTTSNCEGTRPDTTKCRSSGWCSNN